ncbi:hypothetical protein FPZ24_09995 [Sphingomonas panacisoli]|uniref:Uncharacterized protein n=1 Tax=Sphingomonas panacisoli TaxID=1813879 RepID=A0A5B8LIM7_9SPHN|nr:hypothetical protein [Sphingomonas panacisoli]QDZ07776.1 hypothetical protein FPZ24_09995 [Sphingomonas panacisoli]
MLVLLSLVLWTGAAVAQTTVQQFLSGNREAYDDLSPGAKREVRRFATDVWVPLINAIVRMQAMKGCMPEREMGPEYRRLQASRKEIEDLYQVRRRELEASFSPRDIATFQRIFIPLAPPQPVCPPTRR